MRLVASAMTSGGDVLLPGGSQMVQLEGAAHVEALNAVSAETPPEFAYTTVDAWGDVAAVGTVAVIGDLQVRTDGEEVRVTVLCSGVGRYKVVGEGRGEEGEVEVREFWDDEPREEDLAALDKLETSLMESMKEIVRLSLKLSGAENDVGKETALAETLKRVEAFAEDAVEQIVENGHDEAAKSNPVLQHWAVGLEANRRRELLSFIMVDLLNLSFMERKSVLVSTNTKERLEQAEEGLEPFIKELAAKGAIVSALGSQTE